MLNTPDGIARLTIRHVYLDYVTDLLAKQRLSYRRGHRHLAVLKIAVIGQFGFRARYEIEGALTLLDKIPDSHTLAGVNSCGVGVLFNNLGTFQHKLNVTDALPEPLN